jgi:putative Mg2+ transporter-C (MgtC) family protein
MTELEFILQQLIEGISLLFHQAVVLLTPIIGEFDSILVGRLVLVVILSGIIGLERSKHERASGFRPHILVGVGACLMAMAGAYASFPDATARDPMRVASYVISGIGFLGAGAIIRHGPMVRGLTTAASIWGTAGVGVATGVGMGGLAIVTTLLIWFTLVALEWVEPRLESGDLTNYMNIHLKDGSHSVGKALTALERLGILIQRADIVPAANKTSILRVELDRPLNEEKTARIIEQLLMVKAITRVDVSAVEEELDSDNHQDSKDRKNKKSQDDHLNLDDDNLLSDLNELEDLDMAESPKEAANTKKTAEQSKSRKK